MQQKTAAKAVTKGTLKLEISMGSPAKTATAHSSARGSMVKAINGLLSLMRA